MKRHLLIDKIISKCLECPYMWISTTCIFPQCEHPKRKKKNSALMNEGGIPPDWCPIEPIK